MGLGHHVGRLSGVSSPPCSMICSLTVLGWARKGPKSRPLASQTHKATHLLVLSLPLYFALEDEKTMAKVSKEASQNTGDDVTGVVHNGYVVAAARIQLNEGF